VALCVTFVTVVTAGAAAPDFRRPIVYNDQLPYAPGERLAEALSLNKSARYLDTVARTWMQQVSCGACHANFSYFLCRPLLAEEPAPFLSRAREYQESRVANLAHRASDAEVVATAASLVFHDLQTVRQLQPATSKVLSQMWSLQTSDGSWRKGGCGSFPPAENDRYYIATLAAVAVGLAPDGYAQTTEARAGLAKLRSYFQRAQPPDLHHQAMLMWASRYLDGLMSPAQREATVKALRSAQRTDGGWSFETLRPNRGQYYYPSVTESDGYGTGFAVFMLRQAGVAADRPEITRGLQWLRSQQRASGRWFTPSPDAHIPSDFGGYGTRDLYIMNIGTAFAVLALKAGEGKDLYPGGHLVKFPVPRQHGLALRLNMLDGVGR
jgi:squalene-hopene/tetraprenyl-beta-curcumene cyclase